MSNLLYVLAALSVSMVASLVLWYRQRRPRSLDSGITDFQREMQALAPERRTSTST